jgi:Tol biopolymer transport system component
MSRIDVRRLAQFGGVLIAAGTCTAVAVATGEASTLTGRIVFAARSPFSYGEIYRVDSNGNRIDLSNSPASDVAPSVSPDGKYVAFGSARGGRAAVYVVGIDGRGLRRVSPRLSTPDPNDGALLAAIAWSPDSSHFATEISGALPGKPGVYVGDLRGHWRLVGRDADPGQANVAWSPSGRYFSYTASVGSIEVVDRAGRRGWNVPGGGSSGWSAHDVLAVAANSYTTALYSASGKAIRTFPGQESSWSPDGRVLAVLSGKQLQFRRDGAAPFATARVARPAPQNGPVSGIQWIDAGRLRILTGTGWTGFDLTQRRWFAVPAADVYDSVVSADGAVAAPRFTTPDLVELSLLQIGSNAKHVIASAPSCGDDTLFANLQFVPHQNALVYQSGCYTASADIYTVNPDGSGLHQVTNTLTDETQPSLSPDGQNIVYVQQSTVDGCKGCAQTLWRVPASGGTPQQLTSHGNKDIAPFDASPSWSPDGKQIAFQNSGASTALRLFAIPSAGGPAQALHLQGGVGSPVWGPQKIAFVDTSLPKIVVKTLDPVTAAARTVATGGQYEVGGLAWSVDGRLAYLYYGASKTLIATVGAAKQLDLSALLPPHSRIAALAWSPDGSRFAFTATDANGVGEIYTIATDGSGLTQVTKDFGAVDSPGVSDSLSWR